MDLILNLSSNLQFARYHFHHITHTLQLQKYFHCYQFGYHGILYTHRIRK